MTVKCTPANAVIMEDITMDDHHVYLEKLSAFSRMLRIQGLTVSPQETADACRILIEIGFEDREAVHQALRTIYAKSRYVFPVDTGNIICYNKKVV